METPWVWPGRLPIPSLSLHLWYWNLAPLTNTLTLTLTITVKYVILTWIYFIIASFRNAEETIGLTDRFFRVSEQEYLPGLEPGRDWWSCCGMSLLI